MTGAASTHAPVSPNVRVRDALYPGARACAATLHVAGLAAGMRGEGDDRDR